MPDRGLLSLKNIAELTGTTDQGGSSLEFIFAVPAQRYADLVPTFRDLSFDEAGFADDTVADDHPIVTHALCAPKRYPSTVDHISPNSSR